MLRGNFTAKIDDKGRLKIPAVFRSLVEEKYGAALFVTSLTGKSVRILPDAGMDRDRRQARPRPFGASLTEQVPRSRELLRAARRV